MEFRTDTTTATAGSTFGFGADEPAILTLRWVIPSDVRVTILATGSLVLGRDPTSATPLHGAQVSRRHAEVTNDGSSCRIVDLASKNGTFVSSQPVKAAALCVGDVVRLGDAVAVVEATSPAGLPGFGELAPGVYGGALLRSLVARAKNAAASALNIVLLGATGTGKECFARAVHGFSARRGLFLAINCATYQDSTAAAELFGYRKGAFTGADSTSPGHLRAAAGGTLFLDEVAELSLGNQAMLLRAIEQKEVIPLGETRPVSIDVRFLCASQVPLAQLAAAGKFRSDLRARLEGVVIELPALAERRADIVPLFLQLLARHGYEPTPRVDAKLAERLCLHDWPMNVRELENLARRIVATHPGAPQLTCELVRDCLNFDSVQPPPKTTGRKSRPAYSDLEHERLQEALARHGDNVSRAAEELGLSRPRVYRMLKATARKR
jgi:transcriptional regulator of acetoin/glycerol metabolism